MASARGSDRWIVVIGVLKLLKAGAVGVLGVGAILARGHDPVGGVREAVHTFGLAPGSRVVNALVTRAAHLREHDLALAAGVLLAYAAVFVVEGVALLLRKRWGEYLTVLVTGSFVPFEVYEIARHATALRAAGLALNVVVVAYLAWHLRQRR